MCECTCVSEYVYICMYMHMLYEYIYMCMYTCEHACAHVYCICVWVWVRMHMYVYESVHVGGRVPVHTFGMAQRRTLCVLPYHSLCNSPELGSFTEPAVRLMTSEPQ